jgi:glycosyltransferase involved in cell wall biosynthesis
MTCSIVIVTRDRRQLVGRAISSALAQRPECEVLVVDDGSTDGTTTAVQAEFPTVRVERSGVSLGPSAQRNRAAQLASSDVVVMLDDDAYFASERTVAQTLGEFDHPQVAVVAMPFVNVRRSNEVMQRAPRGTGAYVAGVFVAAAAAYRRDVYCAVGGYAGDLRRAGEEGDLTLRLLAEGYVVRLGRADPVIHEEAALAKTPTVHYLSARNGLLFAWRNVPTRYLALRMTAVSGRALLVAYRGRQTRAALHGLVAGAAGLRRAQRRPVPLGAYRLARNLISQGPRLLDDVLTLYAPAGSREDR